MTVCDDPLPNGEPDLGCILTFRVRMGLCKTLALNDPLMAHWHDAEVGDDTLSRSISTREATARARAKFEHRRPAPKDGAETPQLRIVYDSAFSAGCPCTPRCKKGMHSCPKANGGRVVRALMKS